MCSRRCEAARCQQSIMSERGPLCKCSPTRRCTRGVANHGRAVWRCSESRCDYFRWDRDFSSNRTPLEEIGPTCKCNKVSLKNISKTDPFGRAPAQKQQTDASFSNGPTKLRPTQRPQILGTLLRRSGNNSHARGARSESSTKLSKRKGTTRDRLFTSAVGASITSS